MSKKWKIVIGIAVAAIMVCALCASSMFRNIAVALGNAPTSPEVVRALESRLDHPSARHCAVRAAVNAQGEQGGLDFGQRALAIGEVRLFNPVDPRRAAQFQIGREHCRKVGRVPCLHGGIDLLFQCNGGIGTAHDAQKQRVGRTS